MVLDATMSGEFANSYVTRAYADTYFSGHYVADKTALWATFSDTQKDSLLIHAVLFGLENLTCVATDLPYGYDRMYWNRAAGVMVQFYGGSHDLPYKYSSTQNLQFPRTYDIAVNGSVFIPEDIKIAQCEQAIFIADQDETVLTNSAKGLKSEDITVGPIKLSEEYMPGSFASSQSPIAVQIMKKFLLKNISGARLSRA